MKFYLLDGVAAGFVFGAMIVFMIIIIVLEAVTMLLMKYNKAGKAFLDAFLINLRRVYFPHNSFFYKLLLFFFYQLFCLASAIFGTKEF